MTSMPADAKNAAVMTMADMIELMAADPALPEARRRNLASSIRRFCAALGIVPDQAPAAFWFFRERLEGFHPARAGIKPRRWQTIRSDVAFALKRIGLAPDQPKPRVPLSAAWTELQARMQQAGIRWRLSRLAGFCDGRGVPPSAVDDRVIAEYDAFVRTQTFKTKLDMGCGLPFGRAAGRPHSRSAPHLRRRRRVGRAVAPGGGRTARALVAADDEALRAPLR